MYVPARSWASVNDTPAARTLTRTSPGPGRGSSSSTTRNTSGPPWWSTTTRFISTSVQVADCVTIPPGSLPDIRGFVLIPRGLLRTWFKIDPHDDTSQCRTAHLREVGGHGPDA